MPENFGHFLYLFYLKILCVDINGRCRFDLEQVKLVFATFSVSIYRTLEKTKAKIEITV